MSSASKEYNFDGLIGPTHNFGGLALGNTAAQAHKYQISRPQAAALQGLKKMKLLHDLGVLQGIIPPQERPDFQFLREQGFKGRQKHVIEQVSKKKPELLLTAYSASAMWTANAATVSPLMDCSDERLHLTIANLVTHKHRAMEAKQTFVCFKTIFSAKEIFTVHEPLPDDGVHCDEGAANHMRLCPAHGKRGFEIFVYGKKGDGNEENMPLKHPARQSLAASQAVAAQHKLKSDGVVFVQQNPHAIDAGVFHNDVIATSNENVLLYHEEAFVDTADVIKEIQHRVKKISDAHLHLIKITSNQMSLTKAVRSYFFNSQIVTLADGTMALIAPAECEEKSIRSIIDKIIREDNPISQVHFVNLNESMKNGGGPACLRLRIVLSPEEQKKISPQFLFNREMYAQLENWINKRYRDKLKIDDLKDPHLLDESHRALDELTQILRIGSFYSFQRA